MRLIPNGQWFRERLPLEPILGFLREKRVPQHKFSIWYLFGGLALFFFGVQVVTGLLLLVYYSPTPATAHESVMFIMTQVPFGWLLRSVHSWSAHLMIATVFVHLFSTYLMKAYRKPREMMWMSGVVLMMLVLGFGFTGYLLPWDTISYFATQIGTEIPRSAPVLGPFVVSLLRGGEFVSAESLTRLFALHVAVLPIISLILIAVHLVLNQYHGASKPIGVPLRSTGIPFYPQYVYRDMLAWTCGLAILLSLVFLFPVNLGPKADPYASAPLGIRPEWYFLVLFQTLRMMPSSIFGVDGELVVNTGVLLVGLGLLAVPFLDRKASREEPSRIFTIVGWAGIAYLAATITLAYLT
jgi:cytochrome b6